MLKSYKVVSALAVLAGVISQSSIAAPCTFLTNTTTPIFITAAGRYCLTRDVVSIDGSSVWIQADNVTLDLLGHNISTRFVSNFGSTGINAPNSRSVVVTNGTVQGFETGILLGSGLGAGNAGDYVVSRMKIRDTTSRNFRAVAVYAQGNNVTLTDNVISNVTGVDAYGFFVISGFELTSTPNVTGKLVIRNNQIDHVSATGTTSPATGIYAGILSEALISGNSVTEIKTPSAVQFAVGISVLPNASSGAPSGFLDIAGNFVWNAAPTANGKGIYLAAGVSHSVVHDSVIGGMNTGIFTAPAGGSALYLYNSVAGAATPYFGGIMGPNNQSR